MMTFNLVVISCFLLLGLWARRHRARRDRDRVLERVDVDDLGVRHTLVDGTVEAVTWAELVRVEAVTTDQGPYVEDLYFLLFARDGHGCAVRQDHSQAVLPRLLDLPGFDHAAFVTACGSTENARFVCWVAPETTD